MASDRASLVALRELVADTDLTLETIPDLPQNRTAHCRENLRAALALADDLLKQGRDERCRRTRTQTRKHHGQETRLGALSPDGRCPQDAGRRKAAQAELSSYPISWFLRHSDGVGL